MSARATRRCAKRRLFTGARAVVALASVAALLVTGIVSGSPAPRPAPWRLADDGMVVQATGNGIQVRKGGQTLRLMNPGKHVIVLLRRAGFDEGSLRGSGNRLRDDQ